MEIESLEVPESLLARTEPTPEEQPQSLIERPSKMSRYDDDGIEFAQQTFESARAYRESQAKNKIDLQKDFRWLTLLSQV